MRALQRLLHEKELDLEQYDTSIAELKTFIQEGHSLYFEPDGEGEAQSEAESHVSWNLSDCASWTDGSAFHDSGFILDVYWSHHSSR